MRSYPRNSPQASARLVALAMIADGHVSRSEVDAVLRTGAATEMGLAPGELGTVLQALCEDLLQGVGTQNALSFGDDALIHALMDEVDDAALQALVLRVAAATVAADGHHSAAERYVLERLQSRWARYPAAQAQRLAA